MNNKLHKCLQVVVIKFYHIFINELVFTFFFLKYQNHVDIKKSPFKNSGNSWGKGGGGVIKDPFRMENPGRWRVRIKESSVGEVWIFSGTTHSQLN